MQPPRNRTASARGGQPRPVIPPAEEERGSGVPAGMLVVGIGASAGALEALERFFARMPGNSGLSFVVVPHLDRHHESVLAELLGRFTEMPVRDAVGGTSVEPDSVYIIQPNAELTLRRGLLHVTRAAETGLRLPVDTFLRSLAEELGESSVGIILSGTGADGTVGLRAIKERGGLTIAQSPETAKYEGMPQSAIAAGLADFVLPVEEMPGRLLEYQRQRGGERRVQEQALDAELAASVKAICDSLQRRTGHDFGRYKEATLVRRVRRRVLVTHAASAAEYLRFLDEDASEPELLLKDLLIGVTQFFRDPEAFHVLAGQVLPNLFEGKPRDAPVRIWVPGCASGEEAYSIAMLAREHLERVNETRMVQIFATDLDTEQLTKARLGTYPKEVSAQLTPERLARFFASQGDSLQVAKELREMCIFSAHSLIKDPPFSSLDLISCRNLLIYLDPDLQAKLVPLFHYALRPGGYLFLGPSEGLAAHPELFSTVDKKHRIFRRSETVSRPRLDVPITIPGAAQAAQPAATHGRTGSGRAPALSQAIERVILTEYAPACVVIDERGQIRYSAGRTGLYLQSPPGGPTNDLLEMAPGILGIELRTALIKAAKTGRKVVRNLVPAEVDGRNCRLRLTVRPLPGVEPEARLFLVVLQEAAPPEELEAAEEEPAPPDAPVIERLATELRTSRTDLQSAMEELASANEELRSSNEELASTNEELQSANEELQTAQEEMQSINEELESVNAELYEKVQEANAANTELQNLYASSQIATVFLDPQLCIARFTPAAKTLLRLIDGDVGRPIADLAARFEGEHILADAEASLRTGAAFERQVRTAEGVWFLKRVVPYRNLDHTIAAVSVTFVDITALKRAEEAVRESEQRFRTMANSIPQLAWMAHADGFIYWYNERWYGYTGATPEQMEGWGWQSVHDPVTLPKVLEQWKASIATGAPFDMVFPLRGADGRFRPFLTRVMPLKDSEGRVVQWFGTNTDISERVEIEETLREREAALQEADRKRNQFLAVLSHELRNPLTPIRNSLSILDRAAPGGDQAKRAHSVIDRQVAHLTRLVDDLLDVTRITRGKIQLQREPLDLSDLVQRTVEDHRPIFSANGVELEAAPSDGAVHVYGDPTRLAQVVGNLLTNAAKFTPRGGSTRVSVQRDNQAAEAVVRVADTGVGIPPDIVSRLFEPFVQGDRTLDRSQGGLGLGLALVKGLVEMHGGSVSAHSEGTARGTEFTIRLALDEKVEKSAAAAHGTGDQQPPRRILVIEDNTDAADSLREVLELAGHEVAVAYDGTAGIRKARDFKPDLVLCDIGLPGMDGYEVARTFRSEGALKGMHLVAVTGYAMPEDLERAARAGFERHLAKPPAVEKLEQMLASLPPPEPHGPSARPPPDRG